MIISLDFIRSKIITRGKFATSPCQSRGVYSQKNWVGVCGPLPKTLTLFMTKICDFLYPIYDLTKKFDTLFMTCSWIITLFQTCLEIISQVQTNVKV